MMTGRPAASKRGRSLADGRPPMECSGEVGRTRIGMGGTADGGRGQMKVSRYARAAESRKLTFSGFALRIRPRWIGKQET
jgi:hypothetical protein